jgi:hypothetical protein
MSSIASPHWPIGEMMIVCIEAKQTGKKKIGTESKKEM